MVASELCLAVISDQHSCHLFLSYSTISFEDLSTLFFCFLGNLFFLAGLRNYFLSFRETLFEPMSPVICCCFSIKITFLLGAAFIRRAVWCVELSRAAHHKIFLQPFLSCIVLNFCMIGLFAHRHIWSDFSL